MSYMPPEKDQPADVVERRKRRQRDVGNVLGALLVLGGGWLLIVSTFGAEQWCNAFRCERQYDTGAIGLALLLLAFGVALLWPKSSGGGS